MFVEALEMIAIIRLARNKGTSDAFSLSSMSIMGMLLTMKTGEESTEGIIVKRCGNSPEFSVWRLPQSHVIECLHHIS